MRNIHFILMFFLCLLAFACKKSDNWTNPYDDPSLLEPPDTSTPLVLNPASIEGLHKNIFRPTCANSGCHDGTFEPDFRSIESSYQTLVYHGIVKNNPQGSYRYRVFPGMADSSVIIARLTYDIDGQSGLMPLQVDPLSDWYTKQTQYIQDLRDWINAGAKDMFGNTPSQGNYQPMVGGIFALANGTGNPLGREPGKGPIKVNPGTGSVDIYFSITDAETAPNNLTYNKVRFSLALNDFSTATELDLLPATPVFKPGFVGDTVEYRHKVTVNPALWPQLNPVFFRIYVQDAGPSVTEIPNYGSEDYIKKYSAFIVK